MNKSPISLCALVVVVWAAAAACGSGTPGSPMDARAAADGAAALLPGASCAPYDGSGSPIPGCYPVSCDDGFWAPACGSSTECGAGARCVPLETLSAAGTPATYHHCMKICASDADCGRPGLLACDQGLHVCTDFQGEFLASYGSLGGHGAGGSACAGSSPPPSRSPLAGANVESSNPADRQAAEVSVAIDPSGSPFYIAYNSDGRSEISRSDDGGRTWTPIAIPDAQNIGDPALAVDPADGTLYYAYIAGYGTACTSGNTFPGGNEIHLVRSNDHGRTLLGPTTLNVGPYAASPNLFMDKPQAVVGPESDVYVTFDAAQVYTAAVVPSDIVLAKSTDHGATFADVRASDTARTAGRDLAQPAVDAAGDLFVSWQEPAVVGGIPAARFGRVYVARSIDRGQTFSASVAANPTDPSVYWPHSLAITPDGSAAYVAYQRWTGTVDVFDIAVVLSTDGAQTFGAPVKANDDATCATHWLPAMALGPAGDPYVIWYDNRYGDLRVMGAAGTRAAGALTFGPSFQVTDGGEGAFCTGRGVAAITDYIGFAAHGGTALAGWADLRDLGGSTYARVFTSVVTLPR